MRDKDVVSYTYVGRDSDTDTRKKKFFFGGGGGERRAATFLRHIWFSLRFHKSVLRTLP